MSTKIYMDGGFHEIDLTQFYGGKKRDICIQVTGHVFDGSDEYFGYIHLTKAEARRIGREISAWGNNGNP